MADDQSVEANHPTVASSAKADNAISTDRVRCTRKTGRWLISHSGTTALLSSDGRTRP